MPYQPTTISRNAFLALLNSDIDTDYVLEVSTGKKIRINDLKNPIDSKTLQSGLKHGVYQQIERSFPKSALLDNDNWVVNGIDPVARTAFVTLETPSGLRYISCSLNVPNQPCNALFCVKGG